MKILVKKLQGGECNVEVYPTTYVSEIKREVAQLLNIPVDQQKLLLLGRTLVDDQMVQTYPIKEGTKLNLVVMKPECLFEASVKFFKNNGMSEIEAKNAATRLLKIVEEKFNKMSWDDVDRLAEDCLVEEGVVPRPHEVECEDIYNCM